MSILDTLNKHLYITSPVTSYKFKQLQLKHRLDWSLRKYSFHVSKPEVNPINIFENGWVLLKCPRCGGVSRHFRDISDRAPVYKCEDCGHEMIGGLITKYSVLYNNG